MPSISDPTPCKECGFDAHSVSPGDAVVALKTYPRRYRAVLAVGDADEQQAGLETPPGGGWSAAAHAAHVADLYDRATDAISRITTTDNPTVDLGSAEPSATAIDDVMSHLSKAANGLAAAVEAVRGGKSWKRTGTTTEGTSVSALQVLQHCVHIGVHHLHEVERTLAAVRHGH